MFLVLKTSVKLTAISYPCNMVQEMVNCLTHFSYLHSNQALILTDLKPIVFKKDKILVNESVIYSKYGQFNSSDLGIKGIEKFKKEHKCGIYCKELNLI
jgi:hypothetical protein